MGFSPRSIKIKLASYMVLPFFWVVEDDVKGKVSGGGKVRRMTGNHVKDCS